MAMTPALSAMMPILITHIAAGSLAILSGAAVEKNPERGRVISQMCNPC
jgi:hypothetical protein